MEKQKWKKIEKRLLDNSFFLLEVFEKDNSVIFCFLFFFSVSRPKKKREREQLVWFNRKKTTKNGVVLCVDCVMMLLLEIEKKV